MITASHLAAGATSAKTSLDPSLDVNLLGHHANNHKALIDDQVGQQGATFSFICIEPLHAAALEDNNDDGRCPYGIEDHPNHDHQCAFPCDGATLKDSPADILVPEARSVKFHGCTQALD